MKASPCSHVEQWARCGVQLHWQAPRAAHMHLQDHCRPEQAPDTAAWALAPSGRLARLDGRAEDANCALPSMSACLPGSKHSRKLGGFTAVISCNGARCATNAAAMQTALSRAPVASCSHAVSRRRCVVARAEALTIPAGFKKVTGASVEKRSAAAGDWVICLRHFNACCVAEVSILEWPRCVGEWLSQEQRGLRRWHCSAMRPPRAPCCRPTAHRVRPALSPRSSPRATACW